MVGFLGAAGFIPAADLLSDDLEMMKDVLRHVGITHHLNRGGNENTTALWAGDSPKMIFFNYKGKTTRKRTRKFMIIKALSCRRWMN